jgi:hypothetical protein
MDLFDGFLYSKFIREHILISMHIVSRVCVYTRTTSGRVTSITIQILSNLSMYDGRWLRDQRRNMLNPSCQFALYIFVYLRAYISEVLGVSRAPGLL